MGRITIILPDDVDARLRLEARRRDSSIAAVVREAIERRLPQRSADGRLGFFSVGEGAPADVSERVDEFVGRALNRYV
jgi:Ribbon-helix-helix protein, copG family